jgi:hypothetical protein
VDICRRDLTDSDAVDVIQKASQSASGKVVGQLQILYETIYIIIAHLKCTDLTNSLTPARQPSVDGDGRYLSNAEAPISFTRETFNRVVDILGFHKGFFSKRRHCQVARLHSEHIKSMQNYPLVPSF